MTPKIVKVERTQYFDYRPFTPSFMLVNQLEEEARRQVASLLADRLVILSTDTEKYNKA